MLTSTIESGDVREAEEAPRGRQHEEHRVDAIEDATVGGEDASHVLHPEVPLHRRLEEIAERREDGDERAEGECDGHRQRMDARDQQPGDEEVEHEASDETLDRLTRTETGGERR